ncbi:23S rRNA (adenine(2030)-N(6))-methyltransferase RlmJ [Pseudomethylobacillus aquaticus]|uniref:Ribosomal RNA large subunit methyltransferase J n=1 Tax=Pseudomethylobacillus aquaticus TaxID=2676064 RepID=A0A3N0V6J6_9PROT|nr:23S rRNA (adenine(2030)-N(6))-methyltransferase RlmJ [Pseudomethylobacillus aquaticus]ROH88343.1 23S rRNA (adenine(2030)-N(6))-methyltransferase RlmJ [Pseudomethylobacillus aquaticus]
MLSYRHGFHAGNHADVLKHFVLTQVLRHAALKEKPYSYIDTHAGAGMYALDHGFAAQNAEFNSGIARLWEATDLPAALAEYVALVKACNKNGPLRHYPGSPVVAQRLLRPQDRMRLFELHPNDFKPLQQQMSSRQIIVEQADGFNGIKALLPPPSRRAITLIDPPYEDKQDYRRLVQMLRDSLQRFATGTYMVWYPLLQRQEPAMLAHQLSALPVDSWLHVSLSVHAPSADGFGMHGSGMFVINPPWTLPAVLEDVMPVLVQHLGQDDAASFSLDSHIP